MSDDEEASTTHPSSLPPNSHGYAPPTTSWVLLSLKVFIADRENATTACGRMRTGEPVRVTFCIEPPPQVSYICVWCPGLWLRHKIGAEILAAEADLVLIRVSLTAAISRYFLYKASGSSGPSLRLIDDFDQVMPPDSIALLPRRRGGKEEEDRHHHHYYVAVLDLQCYQFSLFNSIHETWTTMPPIEVSKLHFTSKVVTLGQSGLVAFVDLWRGILVCDIPACEPVHYLPLPETLIEYDMTKVGIDPQLLRDVAFVEGRLNLVVWRPFVHPDSNVIDNLGANLSMWSISSPFKGQDHWCMDYSLDFHNLIVDEKTDSPDRVARLPTTGKNSQPPTLASLDLARPMLSLSDKHVVFLVGVPGKLDMEALVLSFDMKNSRVQEAAVFQAKTLVWLGRCPCIQSTISSYFNTPPGTRYVEAGNGKCPAMQNTALDQVLTADDSAIKVAQQHHPRSSPKKIASNSSSCSTDEHKIPESSQGQASVRKTIFVSNLPYNVEYENVKYFFEEAGDIEDVRFGTTSDGYFRGFAHVKFTTAEAAMKAIGFSGRRLMGHLLRLDFAHERASCAPNRRRENISAKKHQTSGNTLFIKGFNTCLGKDQIRNSLKQHFGSCGGITRVSIPVKHETGAVKGIAYMEFRDPGSLPKAFALNGSDLGGFKLHIAEAKPRPDNGGGLGQSQRHGGNIEGREGYGPRGHK